MRRPELIARQARSPSGLLGRALARVMSFETAHANDVALDLLNVKQGDDVLEIGFGDGRALGRLLSRARAGLIAGIDHSPLMVARARRRYRTWIQQNRLDVKRSAAHDIPYPAARFDKVLSVHTIYFWSPQMRELSEIARVLKSSGRLALAFRFGPAARESFPKSVYNFPSPEEVTLRLEERGFKSIRLSSSGTLAWIVAERGSLAEESQEGAHGSGLGQL